MTKRILIDHRSYLRFIWNGSRWRALGLLVIFEVLVELINVDLSERRASRVLRHSCNRPRGLFYGRNKQVASVISTTDLTDNRPTGSVVLSKICAKAIAFQANPISEHVLRFNITILHERSELRETKSFARRVVL